MRNPGRASPVEIRDRRLRIDSSGQARKNTAPQRHPFVSRALIMRVLVAAPYDVTGVRTRMDS